MTTLHPGIRVRSVDLKTDAGQKVLQRELAKTDVLLTSFRPSALKKLGLDWASLHRVFPALSLVMIVGAPGARAEAPGHDLTYLAENDLVTGLDLPATLYADMAGALMAVEAVLQAVLLQGQTGKGRLFEVALSEAAAHLALPRQLGPDTAGHRAWRWPRGLPALPLPGWTGGFGRPGAAFCQIPVRRCGAGLDQPAMMMAPATQQAIAGFVAQRSCGELEELAVQHDIPLHTLPN